VSIEARNFDSKDSGCDGEFCAFEPHYSDRRLFFNLAGATFQWVRLKGGASTPLAARVTPGCADSA
jgi:hypothetical protein